MVHKTDLKMKKLPSGWSNRDAWIRFIFAPICSKGRVEVSMVQQY